MKILHTIYDDIHNPWCGGGGAVRAFEINRRLARKHDITVLTGNYPGAKSRESREGVRIVHVGSARNDILSRLSYSILTPWHVHRIPFDLWVYDFSAFAPLFVSPHVRKRALLVFHHRMSGHALKKYPGVGLIAWAAEIGMVRRARHIIAVSPGTASRIRRLVRPDARIDVVPNGVDASCFVPKAGEKDYILSFGRLDVYAKGIDILLQAFTRIHTDYPGVRLLIAGRGSAGRIREIESLCSELGLARRVEVIGPVSDRVKQGLFGGARFTCMPSRYEGWGIAAVEAGAAGKAVIGTDIPGLADAICHGKTGLLVPPENADALAGAMRRLLDDPEVRHRLGTAGRHRARRFTWDRIAEDQERIYRQVAERYAEIT